MSAEVIVGIVGLFLMILVPLIGYIFRRRLWRAFWKQFDNQQHHDVNESSMAGILLSPPILLSALVILSLTKSFQKTCLTSVSYQCLDLFFFDKADNDKRFFPCSQTTLPTYPNDGR